MGQMGFCEILRFSSAPPECCNPLKNENLQESAKKKLRIWFRCPIQFVLATPLEKQLNCLYVYIYRDYRNFVLLIANWPKA